METTLRTHETENDNLQFSIKMRVDKTGLHNVVVCMRHKRDAIWGVLTRFPQQYYSNKKDALRAFNYRKRIADKGELI